MVDERAHGLAERWYLCGVHTCGHHYSVRLPHHGDSLSLHERSNLQPVHPFKDFQLVFFSHSPSFTLKNLRMAARATPRPLRRMTVVSSPSSLCVAVAPYTRPALCVPYHALRRRASESEAASSGGVSDRFLDPPVTSTALVWSTKSPLGSSSRRGLDIANSLRGGCATTGREDVRRRGRPRRPLRRFFPPALVW